jgi:hypothetical protein
VTGRARTPRLGRTGTLTQSPRVGQGLLSIREVSAFALDSTRESFSDAFRIFLRDSWFWYVMVV